MKSQPFNGKSDTVKIPILWDNKWHCYCPLFKGKTLVRWFIDGKAVK